MGVNRIVMHNGVVWWLAPPRRRRDAPGGPAERRHTDQQPSDSGAAPSRDPAALPTAGFIPLSSLGLPGIDAIFGNHAELYRQAYERAVRELGESGGRGANDHHGADPGPDRAGPPPADTQR